MEKDLQLVDVINDDSLIRPAVDIRFQHFASYSFTVFERDIPLDTPDQQARYYGSFERTVLNTPSLQVLDVTKPFMYKFFEWLSPETKCMDLIKSGADRPAGTCSNSQCDTADAGTNGNCGPSMGYKSAKHELPANVPEPTDGDFLGCNFGFYKPPTDLAEQNIGLRNVQTPRPEGTIGAAADAIPLASFKYQICFDALEDITYTKLGAACRAANGTTGANKDACWDFDSVTNKDQLCMGMPEKAVTEPRMNDGVEGLHAVTTYGFDKCFQLWNHYSATARSEQRYVRYTQKAQDVEKCFKPNEMDLSIKKDFNGRKVMPITTTGHAAVGLESGKSFVYLIKEVRKALAMDAKLIGDLADKEDGDVFPYGVPFIFWEQYVTLDAELIEKLTWSLLVCLGMVIMLFIILIEENQHGPESFVKRIVAAVWGALIVCFLCAVTVIQIYGFMAIMKIKLNAIPQVSLIMSIGLTVEFTAHTILAYMNAPAIPGQGWLKSRRSRVTEALDKMAVPTLHGSMTTFLGILMLSSSNSKFVMLYYFTLYGLLIAFGTFNGLAVLPTLLCLVGPLATRTAKVDGAKPVSAGNVEGALGKA